MKKVYIIEGVCGYSMFYNKKFLNFRRSNILRPCCFYHTNDAGEQKYIESSAMYKKGLINIYSCECAPVNEVIEEVEAVNAVAEEPKLKDNLQVKSLTSAVNILVQKYGANEDELDTAEKAIEFARSKGLRFVKLEEAVNYGKE